MTKQAKQIMEQFLTLISGEYAENRFLSHMSQKNEGIFVLKTNGTKGVYKTQWIELASKGGSKCESKEEESYRIKEMDSIDMVLSAHKEKMKTLRKDMKSVKGDIEKKAIINEVIRKVIACQKEETMIIKLSQAKLVDEMLDEINRALNEYYKYTIEEDNSYHKDIMVGATKHTKEGYTFNVDNERLRSERTNRVLVVSSIKVHLLTIVIYAPSENATLLEHATASVDKINNVDAITIVDHVKHEKDVAMNDSLMLKQYLYDINSLHSISFYQADAIAMSDKKYRRLLRITLACVAVFNTTLSEYARFQTDRADKVIEEYASITHDHNSNYVNKIKDRVVRTPSMISVEHTLLSEDAHHISRNITGCNSGSTAFKEGVKIGFGRNISVSYHRILKGLTQ